MSFSVDFSKATVYFKDGHHEACMLEPFSSTYCRIYCNSGIFVVRGFDIYKYDPSKVSATLWYDGSVEYDLSDCYFVDTTVERVEVRTCEERAKEIISEEDLLEDL